jgi:hypothetical protein
MEILALPDGRFSLLMMMAHGNQQPSHPDSRSVVLLLKSRVKLKEVRDDSEHHSSCDIFLLFF